MLESQVDELACRSELATDHRLALDAYKRETLEDLAAEDELDELDDDAAVSDDDDDPASDGRVRGALMQEPADLTRDYVPPLDRSHGVFRRVASRALIPIGAIVLIVIAMGGTWSTADATPSPAWSATTPPATRAAPRAPIANPALPVEAAQGTSGLNAIDEPAPRGAKSGRKDLAGKLNLNTASEDQLMLLPTVGPSKAERIVTWRKKNGGFKRTADLRRVKGFGYKTFKKLEPFLDIKGDTTLAAK